MPIFTFPARSLNNTSNVEMQKLLNYYNININKSENIIDSIKQLDYKQRVRIENVIFSPKINIGGYYIPSYLKYDSFIKSNNVYKMTDHNKTSSIMVYSNKQWYKDSMAGYNPEYDRLRSYILFIEQYRHLYCMTQYLINNHILMDDIVTHMLKMNTGYVFI